MYGPGYGYGACDLNLSRTPLRHAWTPASMVLSSVVPRLVLDPAYGFVSRRRKLWFGESDQCRVWDDDWEQRFVDDAVLRGDPG